MALRREAVDDGLFAAPVGLRDEVDVTLIFYFGREGVFFAENFSGFESGFDGDFEERFCVIGQSGLQEKLFKVSLTLGRGWNRTPVLTQRG